MGNTHHFECMYIASSLSLASSVSVPQSKGAPLAVSLLWKATGRGRNVQRKHPCIYIYIEYIIYMYQYILACFNENMKSQSVVY